MSIIIVKTDGSCIPNPGDMGIGIVIYEGKTIVKTISQFIGYGTNNIAEYTAFIRGLEEVKKTRKKEEKVKVFIDSLLIYKQIRGEYRVKKQELKPLCERGKELIKEIGNIEIIWNSRDENGIADCLAKTAIEIEGRRKE